MKYAIASEKVRFNKSQITSVRMNAYIRLFKFFIKAKLCGRFIKLYNLYTKLVDVKPLSEALLSVYSFIKKQAGTQKVEIMTHKLLLFQNPCKIYLVRV
jgi:hypothetical protein